MRVLTFSSLYPNAAQPGHGLFVEQRLRQLCAYASDVDARVVAPVPWFPLKHDVFGQYARYAQVPIAEHRYGLPIVHPRYLVLPKVGMRLTPWTLYRAALNSVRRWQAQGFDFDLIDAHYFYPDGVAAMYLAQALGKPFVVTGRGTDLNVIAQMPGPRKKLQAVVDRAAHLITVSSALRDRLLDLGARPDKCSVLRNGVDASLFCPTDNRDELRQQLHMQGPTILCVGNLVALKGHHLVIEALQQLPQHSLVIVGDGPEEPALREQARLLGVDDRVRFAGRIAQSELPAYYAAADVLVLASSREGWANVLLESMACGTPVVATPVGGNPEVVAAPAAGVLTRERSAQALLEGIQQCLASGVSREATRAYAERFSWDETSQGQLDIFKRLI